MISYKEKFIAFIDVLGFKQLVADSGADTGMTLPEILALLDLLGSSNKLRIPVNVTAHSD